MPPPAREYRLAAQRLHQHRERLERNRERINRLELGASLDAVVAELGTPDFTEAFFRDGTPYRALFYRMHTVRDQRPTSKEETTPLVFVNGALTGWGRSPLERALRRNGDGS